MGDTPHFAGVVFRVVGQVVVTVDEAQVFSLIHNIGASAKGCYPDVAFVIFVEIINLIAVQTVWVGCVCLIVAQMALAIQNE